VKLPADIQRALGSSPTVTFVPRAAIADGVEPVLVECAGDALELPQPLGPGRRRIRKIKADRLLDCLPQPFHVGLAKHLSRPPLDRAAHERPCKLTVRDCVAPAPREIDLECAAGSRRIRLSQQVGRWVADHPDVGGVLPCELLDHADTARHTDRQSGVGRNVDQ